MENLANNDIPVWAPVCEVCKTRDETLRAVSYPYVVSLLVMTFQHTFSGIFCAKHQRKYHLLASLITSTAGWLGIPFGFIMTPVTLFKLARGGLTNAAANIQLLSAVAEKKLSEGDAKSAIRCLEECIKLQDVPEIRSRLAKLYQLNRASTDINDFETIRQFISVPLLLLVSALTGFLIGLLDLLLALLLSPFYGENTSIFIAILSWLPTVTMIFFGILIVRAMLRWTLRKNKPMSLLLGSFLAYTSTFFAFYSVLQGQALIRNLYGLVMFFSISRKDGIFATRSVLTHGGVDVLINNFNQSNLSVLIFTSLLIAGIGLSLFVSLEMVIHAVNGQRRLLQIRESLSMETGNSAMFAWGTLSFIILGFILFIALVFPGQYVNVENAYQEVNLGMSELDQYHIDKAVDHFKAVESAWPSSVTGHLYLGLGYAAQEKYDQASDEFDTGLGLDGNSIIAHLFKAYLLSGQSKFSEAVNEYKFITEAQPTWGSAHANLAALYYILDKTEEEKHELQQALTYGNTDGQTYSSIGAYYLLTQDFSHAEEYYLKALNSTDKPAPEIYLALARIYTSQSNFDKAEKTITEADRQDANPLTIYQAKISLAEYQNRFDLASSLVAEAIKSFPNNSGLYSEKSFIEFQQGHADTAASDAEKAIELNPYNSHAYVELAYAYHSQGKLTEALEMARQAVATAPKYDRAHYILGLCYMDLGMKEDAIAEFENFLELYWERPYVKEYRENVLIYLEELK